MQAWRTGTADRFLPWRLGGKRGLERMSVFLTVPFPRRRRPPTAPLRRPPLGCACAREAGHCEIETVPEEMHGARLAAEPARELLEGPVDPAKRLPEALNRLPIAQGMLAVLGEGCRLGDPVRLGFDVDLNVEPDEYRDELVVERRDRELVRERKRFRLRLARAHDELVRDEIDGDVEITSPGAEAARRARVAADQARLSRPRSSLRRASSARLP